MKKSPLILILFLTFSFTSFAQKQDSLFHILNNTQDDSVKSTVLYEIGKVQQRQDSSIYYWKRGIEKAKKINWYKGQADILYSIAESFSYSFTMDSSIGYWEQAKAAYINANEENPSVKNDLSIANVEYSIALDLYLSEQFVESIKMLNSAIQLFINIEEHSGVNDCYNLLGDIYIHQEDYTNAISSFDDAISYAKEANDGRRLRISYNNKAICLLNIESFDESLKYFQLALEHLENNSSWAYHEIHMNIAQIYINQKRYAEARPLLDKGLEFFISKNAKRNIVIANNFKIKLLIAEKKWHQIISLGRKNLEYLEHYNFLSQKKNTYEYLSEAFREINQKDSALTYYMKYTVVKDTLFNQGKNKVIAKLEAQFEFEKKEREIGDLTEENLNKEIQITEEKNIRYLLIGFIVSGSLLFIVLFLNFKRKQEIKRHRLALMKAEIEQRLLRSQMNPHFIFNALNSIQSYIMANQPAEAEVFLAKFSTLIRNILEHSTHEFIDLDDEVTTLQLYLELEKLRFSEKFDFNIDIQLANLEIQIPPMLIQPFVENAIIHGMKGKKSKGQIDVRFIETDHDMIRCEIEDNGVGRQTKTEENEKHQSLAIKLTNDRLHYFNQESESGFDMRIIDLKDGVGKPVGTKVELFIPIES